MRENNKIKDIELSVLEILDLISKGYNYDAIIRKYPRLTKDDIKMAARTAHDQVLKTMIYNKIRQKVKNDYPGENNNRDDKKNFTGWNTDSDEELERLYRNGASIEEIARIFKLPVKFIESKVKKLSIIKRR